jgi:hypothetical protein
MRIAYILLVHKSPGQFARMLRALHAPGNFYGVHVDRKAPKKVHEAIAAICLEYAEAFIIPPRVVNWAGWSVVAAELRGIKALLDRSEQWDRLVCLSGQDFPLVSQSRLRELLDREPTLNYLNCLPLLDPSFRDKLPRIEYYYIELFRRVRRIPGIRRKRPGSFVVHSGDQWFVLTREFAEFCSNAPVSLQIQRFMRFALVPDEMYFQTVIMNSKYASTCAQRNLRKIRWDDDGGGHPRILTMQDVPWLLEGEACFARKFDETLDDRVLEFLESRLRDGNGGG